MERPEHAGHNEDECDSGDVFGAESGDVYTWGKNSDCQLGLPQVTNSIVATPSRVEMSTSPHTEGKGRRNAFGISGGASHGVALVIVEEGE